MRKRAVVRERVDEELVLQLMQDIRDGADPEMCQQCIEAGLSDRVTALAFQEAMRRLKLEFAPAGPSDPYEDPTPITLHDVGRPLQSGLPARTVVRR